MVTEQGPTTSLLGRAQELALIGQLLESGAARLLTLIGPAGVGKTRLALEAAGRIADAFPGGVWCVDLTPIRDPVAVPSAIALSLGLRDVGPDPLLDRLTAYLRGRETLLILDNVEQVLSAAPLLDILLAEAPGLRLLVTSREALHLRTEQVLPVSPLALPDPRHLPPLDQFAQIPSVSLFLQRAQMINLAFRLTDKNAPAVAELVVHLDGLPLAIELAAARTQLLSPQMLLERLDHRLSLLRWEAQDLPERQQTLRAAIAWSYDLLGEQEKALLRRLSTFIGSFTLEAAEAIAAGGQGYAIDVLDGLAGLVDRSLVQRERSEAEGYRFRLLESVREFAREQLASREEGEAMGRAHARYFLDLAELAAPELVGPRQRDWFLRLEREHDNLRAALRRSLVHGEHDLALRLAGAVGWFWLIRGYHTEAARWLEEVLAATPTAGPTLRIPVLLIAGLLFNDQRRLEAARLVLEEALALAEQRQDQRAIAEALTALGGRAFLAGDLDEAIRLLDAAIAQWERIGEVRARYQVGLAFGYRAAVAFHRGDLDGAVALLRQTLARHDASGDAHSASVTRFYLASLLGEQGKLEEGVQLVREGLLASRGFRDRLLLVLGVEATLFLVGPGENRTEQARLLGAEDALHEALSLTAGVMARTLLPKVERLRELIAQGGLEPAYRAGRALSVDAIADLALTVLDQFQSTPPGEEAATRPVKSLLSEREQEVLRLVAQGLSNKQIGKQLFIAESTAKSYVTGIFNKLGVDSRAHAVAVAVHEGLLEGGSRRERADG